MRNRLIVVLTLVTALAFGLIFARQLVQSRDLDRSAWAEKHVRVLTYGTLIADQGPGAKIFHEFEAAHHVKIDVVVSQDVGLILERLKVAGTFDLVIGLDQGLVERARADFKWRALKIDTSSWSDVPARATDDHFVAFDWSPLTFIYRRDDRSIPATIDDLTKPEFKKSFAVEDPRTTTPGLQFARWIGVLKPGRARAWFENFRPNVNAITPTWSAAYGLFERGQTRFVWTYLTSLAFHWGVEKKREYQPLVFAEGHPVQVEMAAVPDACAECDLGEQLLRGLLTPTAQTAIMNRNFMFPVIKGLEAGTVYAELPNVKPLVIPAGQDLTEWNDVFAR